jgi:hypothetical protein
MEQVKSLEASGHHCDPGTCIKNGRSTFFVHLNDGTVETVTDVSGMTMTRLEIQFQRDLLETVTFPRRDVFYACCGCDGCPVLS